MNTTMTAGKTPSGIPSPHPEEAAELLLDLYLPGASQGSGPLPTVVRYHGDGCRRGCRWGPSAAKVATDASIDFVRRQARKP